MVWLENGEEKRNKTLWLILATIVFVNALIVVPNLIRILPHPDEHQFYANAWSIMGGKALANFLHVAATEYVLALFLSALNILTKSGVNFPQGNPSFVTWFYGHILGYILYLLTFMMGALILQKGETRLRIRTLVFAVLYFGSVGLFERFIRINSDSMSIFAAVNYLFLSLFFHKRRASVGRFFLLNLAFIFLLSFTNFKALYLGLPILALNTFVPFFFFDRTDESHYEGLPKIYRFVFFVFGLLFGTVVLWYFLIPKPVDPKLFWYNIKNATVRGVGFDFEYPSQSYNSWAVYLYDFLAEYLGLSQFLAVLILISAVYFERRRELFSDLRGAIGRELSLERFKNGEAFRSSELLVFLILVSYYFGVSSALVHWSRWGAPLGFFGLILAAVVLERPVSYLWQSLIQARRKAKLFFPILIIFSWSLMITTAVDIRRSNFPTADGFNLTYKSLDKFLKDHGISPADGMKKVAWFTGYTHNVNNISLESLVEPQTKETEYLIWPYWNIGPLYAPGVDRFTTNQSELVAKYGQSISYGFPALMSYYMHGMKIFAWRFLGISWNPELDSLIEPQYGIVKLKKIPRAISLDYVVPESAMSHAYSTTSRVFNLKNLPDSYIFPTCYSNPDVVEVKTGRGVPPPPDLLVGARTEGLYCHSLWYRVLLRGTYRIRIEGLPEDKDGQQKVYSTQKFDYDPLTKTLTHVQDETIISAEFGVATKEKNVPGLKFIVSYDLESKGGQ